MEPIYKQAYVSNDIDNPPDTWSIKWQNICCGVFSLDECTKF